MQTNGTEVSQQDWKNALFEFGGTIYQKEIDAALFAQRGVQAMGRATYRLLNTEGLLYEILNWVGETDPQRKVKKLHDFLKERGLIDSDGNVVRWKERPPSVIDTSS